MIAKPPPRPVGRGRVKISPPVEEWLLGRSEQDNNRGCGGDAGGAVRSSSGGGGGRSRRQRRLGSGGATRGRLAGWPQLVNLGFLSVPVFLNLLLVSVITQTNGWFFIYIYIFTGEIYNQRKNYNNEIFFRLNTYNF
jgi:hypothetical protein